ncbi:MAG TPA: hypothetical protein VGL08_17520 [Paraburkholderia sp.]|jgi:hypothetical protein
MSSFISCAAAESVLEPPPDTLEAPAAGFAPDAAGVEPDDAVAEEPVVVPACEPPLLLLAEVFGVVAGPTVVVMSPCTIILGHLFCRE